MAICVVAHGDSLTKAHRTKMSRRHTQRRRLSLRLDLARRQCDGEKLPCEAQLLLLLLLAILLLEHRVRQKRLGRRADSSS